MTNNNYNAQTDEQIARDILSILPDTPEDPNKEPTESPKVFMLPIRQLKSFQNHPFKIVDNEEMKDLMHSIRDYGVMTPITVYVNKNAEYEIVSGHRRVFACKMLKMTEIPAIIMDYDRDQAVLAMVDSNLHREKLLPSEKGFACKMKLEALKNQHREMEFEMQMRSDEILAKEVGESRATIQRLIRITKLISPFRDLLDYECMTFGGFDAGETVISLYFDTEAELMRSPCGMYTARKGSLLFALPVEGETKVIEYTRAGVVRKFPYCDYHIRGTSDWNCGFASTELCAEEKDVSDVPFSSKNAPVEIYATLAHIDWGFEPRFDRVCAAKPANCRAIDEPRRVRLVPYGCAKLRMTEMPKIK